MLMIKQRVYLASIEAQSSWPVENHFCGVGMEKTDKNAKSVHQKMVLEPVRYGTTAAGFSVFHSRRVGLICPVPLATITAINTVFCSKR